MYSKYLGMMGILDDTYTVLMISRKMKPKLSFEYEDFEYLAIIPEECEDVLIKLVEIKNEADIITLRSTPRVIVMRCTGEFDQYIKAVHHDVQGEIINTDDIFEGYGEGVMIIFTEKRIRGPLGQSDFMPQAIHSTMKFSELMKYLNNHF